MLDNGKCRCTRHVIPVSSCLLYFMYLPNHSSASENLVPRSSVHVAQELRVLSLMQQRGVLRVSTCGRLYNAPGALPAQLCAWRWQWLSDFWHDFWTFSEFQNLAVEVAWRLHPFTQVHLCLSGFRVQKLDNGLLGVWGVHPGLELIRSSPMSNFWKALEPVSIHH